AYFPGLVLCVGVSEDLDPSGLLRATVELLQRYRRARPHGLADAHAGACPSYDAGIVQLVGPRALLLNPRWQARLGTICVLHPVNDASDDVDLVRAYASPPTTSTHDRSPRVWDPLRDQACATAARWGIESCDEA